MGVPDRGPPVRPLCAGRNRRAVGRVLYLSNKMPRNRGVRRSWTLLDDGRAARAREPWERGANDRRSSEDTGEGTARVSATPPSVTPAAKMTRRSQRARVGDARAPPRSYAIDVPLVACPGGEAGTYAVAPEEPGFEAFSVRAPGRGLDLQRGQRDRTSAPPARCRLHRSPLGDRREIGGRSDNSISEAKHHRRRRRKKRLLR
jgi:hypothetical protein